MPKVPTASRTRTGTVTPNARVGAPTIQPGQPFPPRVNRAPRPSNQGTHQRPLALPAHRPGRLPQGEGSDIVHANCNTIFKKADQDRRQLTSQLKEAADTARRWDLEKVQLQGKVRKLVSELNESKQKTQDLEKRLDDATLDGRNYVSRQEHEKTLKELLEASSSVTKMVEAGLNASHNAYMSTFLSDSNVTQEPWMDQSEQIPMLDNPVVPDVTAPTFSISDPPALPDFDDYVAMP
ncbi:hypothetical protein N7530_009758 [Penicillium desertorum]|uniref:Uncharacterized protein n=1 Tax=Penicillium desertorum TaxID=1303715 RepID=A0A9X0BIP2_9EURO|nr:hypothetical protein N7530_009758 [Penicillium desertorum]